jgi:hypothetical protein
LSGVVDGWPVSVADYSYTETQVSTSTDANGNPTTSTTTPTHRFVVTVVRLARPYPAISVQPRGALSRLGRTVFGDGATATGHDAFDRRFRVRTPQPGMVPSVIGPALMAEHLADRLPSWSMYGPELLAYQQGRIGEPEGIPALAAPLLRVADHLHR